VTIKAHFEWQAAVLIVVTYARSVLESLRRAALFMLGCQTALALAQVLASVLLLPPLLFGVELFWVMLVVLPLLCIPIVSSPTDVSLNEHICAKRDEVFSSYPLGWVVKQLALRFGVVLVNHVLVFALILDGLCREGNLAGLAGTCHPLFGAQDGPIGDHGWAGRAGPRLAELHMAQLLALFSTVLCWIFVMSSMWRRSTSVWQRPPWCSTLWVGCSGVVVLLQVVFTAVYLSTVTLPAYVRLDNVPWYVVGGIRKIHENGEAFAYKPSHRYAYVVGCISPCIALITSEHSKSLDVKLSGLYQRRRRLAFETKLGMHSPK
jgi:magnesium-transporting ATPase (P-type)